MSWETLVPVSVGEELGDGGTMERREGGRMKGEF